MELNNEKIEETVVTEETVTEETAAQETVTEETNEDAYVNLGEEKYDIEVGLNWKDLYKFNIYYSYRRVSTWICNLLGLVAIGYGIWSISSGSITYCLCYILLGCLIIFYSPISLISVSKRLVKAPSILSQKFEYIFCEGGVKVAFVDPDKKDQNDAKTTNYVKWNEIYKAVSRKDVLYIFTGPRRASILPYSELAGKDNQIKELLKSKLESHKYVD